MRFLASLHTLSLVSALVAASNPDLKVPKCPSTVSTKFTTQIPSGAACPQTSVELCYTNTNLSLVFTALGETNFYYDPKQTTNDNIWEYEVMEAFIYKGSDDPQTYFEYEVSPNNVTFNAFIFNPSRVRKAHKPFDHAYIAEPFSDGFTVDTVLDKKGKKWTSRSTIPLALFNGENPRGTTWRMNFFRTITSPSTFPNQQLCGWKNTGQANFHITPSFGTVQFV
ncbi:hypothetical protein IWW39_002331 [Coemansia spiralis]|uniref:Carbohydrate-binding domain-containing protein n=1 Tax=Coemansia spiralis TaxID=417178 RepID=A0A9W8L5E7_9FUNG|nr:hypothetical protein IWW39_002331 [Coemansia spiralis]